MTRVTGIRFDVSFFPMVVQLTREIQGAGSPTPFYSPPLPKDHTSGSVETRHGDKKYIQWLFARLLFHVSIHENCIFHACYIYHIL